MSRNFIYTQQPEKDWVFMNRNFAYTQQLERSWVFMNRNFIYTQQPEKEWVFPTEILYIPTRKAHHLISRLMRQVSSGYKGPQNRLVYIFTRNTLSN